MKNFDFEVYRSAIKNKLIYPEELISTLNDAERILQLSSYFLKKLRDKKQFTEYHALGVVFIQKESLLNFNLSEKNINDYHQLLVQNSKEFCFEKISKKVRNKLCYPEDVLLTRKTAPILLKMSCSAFDRLRKKSVFSEYTHLGTKFFNKEEVIKWLSKNRPHLSKFQFKESHSMPIRVAV